MNAVNYINAENVSYRVVPRGNGNITPLTNIMFDGTNYYYFMQIDDEYFITMNNTEISLNNAFDIRVDLRYVSNVILCVCNGAAVFVALVNGNVLIPFVINNNVIVPWQAIVYDIAIKNIVYHDKLYVSTESVDGRYVHHTYSIGHERLIRTDALRIPAEVIYYVDDEIIVATHALDTAIYAVADRALMHVIDVDVEYFRCGVFAHENKTLTFIHHNGEFDQYRRYTVRL